MPQHQHHTDDHSRCMSTRSRYRAAESFVVDTIFPAGAVHLIGGNSGVGKTTWLLKFAKLWSEGGMFLERYKCNPCSWAYIAADRHVLDTDRTCRRLGLGDWDFPLYSVEDFLKRSAKGDLIGEPDLNAIFDAFPNTRLLLIEGFQSFITDPPKGRAQNKHEQIWMGRIRDRLLRMDKTIIATTHAPKSSSDSRHSDPRAGFLGSQSLIGACSTMVSIEQADANAHRRGNGQPVNPSMDRIVRLLGRDYPNHTALYTRAPNGELLLDALSIQGQAGADIFENENDRQFLMDTLLSAIERRAEIPTRTVMEWGEKAAMSPATIERWLESKVSSGELVRIKRGVYMRPSKQ